MGTFINIIAIICGVVGIAAMTLAVLENGRSLGQIKNKKIIHLLDKVDKILSWKKKRTS
jgi:hypothetical protein